MIWAYQAKVVPSNRHDNKVQIPLHIGNLLIELDKSVTAAGNILEVLNYWPKCITDYRRISMIIAAAFEIVAHL